MYSVRAERTYDGQRNILRRFVRVGRGVHFPEVRVERNLPVADQLIEVRESGRGEQIRGGRVGRGYCSGLLFREIYWNGKKKKKKNVDVLFTYSKSIYFYLPSTSNDRRQLAYVVNIFGGVG